MLIETLAFSVGRYEVDAVSGQDTASEIVSLVMVYWDYRVSEVLFFLQLELLIEMLIQGIDAKVSKLTALQKGFVF